MTERAYTVSEIDRMRQVIRQCGFGVSDWYDPAERTAAVEDRLRTYMTGNVDPEDLIETLMEKFSAQMEKKREMDRLLAEIMQPPGL